MGRKQGGSGDGTKPWLNFDRVLRRHIESSAKKYATVEQLVDHLRSTYPHYSRHKLRPFTKRVNQIMQISCSRRSEAMDDSEDGGGTPVIKKRMKVDEKEEKLQLLEAQHLRNRSGDVLNSSGSCSSSSLASASSSEGDEASTSGDAIYGEKFEPEFDLMKSMLRENLRQKSKELGGEREVTKTVELEVVDNKDVKKENCCN